MFLTLPDTHQLLPSRTVAGGLVTLVSVKSGKPGSGSSPYTMRLFWVPTNTSPSAATAVARREELRVGKDSLSVTVTVPLEVALEASEGTARLPVSRRAPLFEVVVER